ncbi:MAG: calcium/sodium antiporter [Patescibacteria group bacterium]
MITIFLFFLGFYILVKGAGFLVDGAVSFAKRLNISHIVIGLIIVGIGTSIPEFAISFIANLSSEQEIGLGTVIGSNTFNILFILGLCAILFPLTLKEIWVRRDLLWNMVSVAIAGALALDGKISGLDGLIMLIIFIFWILHVTKEGKNDHDGSEESFHVVAIPIAILMMLAGFLGTILGGKWVVDGAVEFAKSFGLNETIIGLTIVGIGTSLPELAVSLVAAYKKQPGIAVGNVIGSNIFDFLMILGTSALFKPIIFPKNLFFDTAITLFSAILLYIFMFTGERHTLKRFEGFLFLVLYIAYLLYIIN